MSRVLFALCALAACDSPRPPVAPPLPHPATPVKFVPPSTFDRLRISLTPHLDPQTLELAHRPLNEYLSRGLSVPVELKVASSYDELGKMLAREEIDLAEFSPFAYVRAGKSGVRMQPLVTTISDGSATAAAYILVNAESSFRTLEDLKGRSFAFVDPASTSGFLYPTKVMLDRGIEPKTFFSRTEFLGNHEAVLLAVHEGRFDAGATYQGALRSLQRSRGVDPLSFRIIAKSPRTPRDIFCAREGLPEPVMEELKRLLLAISVLTPEGRAVLRPLNVNGFVLADDRQFDPVREVDAALNGGAR
ncbi:MAG: phosphate/phosphite/phosphonate ABC transporter substrate-binding protein [Myxococcales bacterium]|nr:phosphate/phosphite/phosphonate ABC transporter substrate-binding protein [Myxococcales bacterium]